MKNIKQRIVINTVANAVGRFSILLIGFVIYPFILKYIGIAAVGIMALIDSISGQLGFIQNSFIPSKVKYIAESYAQKNENYLNKVVNNSILISLATGLLVGIVLLIIGINFQNIFKLSENEIPLAFKAVIVSAIGLFFVNALSFSEEIINGIQRHDVLNMMKIVFNIIRVAFIIVFLKLGYGLITLIIINNFSIIALRILLFLYAKKHIHSLRLNIAFIEKAVLLKMVRFTFLIFIISICVFIVRHASKIFVGIYLPLAMVTYYYTSFKVYQVIRSIPHLFVSALLPAVSELYAKNKMHSIKELVFKSTKYCYAAFAMIAIPVMFVSKEILNLWVGPKFAPYAYVIQILLLHLFISLNHVSIAPVVVGMNKMAFAARFSVMLAVLSILFYSTLIKPFGLLGAALGTTLPYFILEAYYLYHAFKILQIKLEDFIRRIYIPISIPAAASIISCLLIRASMNLNSLVKMVIYLCISVITFAVIFFFTSLSNSEKSELRSVFSGFKKEMAWFRYD